jgi:hypothetical protein
MKASWGCVATALLLQGAPMAAPAADNLDPARLTTPLRYDQEYPPVAYGTAATRNRVWRLQQRLERGELRLEWEAGFGYLRSLLRALEIDVESQVLVFSSTSLQFSFISPLSPRAVFFNDDTYVGYVPGTPFIEVASMDADKGVVFHGFDNLRENPGRILREGGRCLICHDTWSMTGGGVPRVLVMSARVDDPGDERSGSAATETDDRTPLGRRWGGWYVTGGAARLAHFGNLPLREAKLADRLQELRAQPNPASLEQYFDTSRHLTPRSDVVALLVLEHQTHIQNLITRLNFKARTLLAGAGADSPAAPRSWAGISERERPRVQALIEPLVRALFFHEAAPFASRIGGGSGFTAGFQSRGPRTGSGESLRDLELGTRLFRYPLSFQIYSEHFEALPAYALDYIHARIGEVLDGKDTTGIGASISTADRAAIRRILIETWPALAARLR